MELYFSKLYFSEKQTQSLFPFVSVLERNLNANFLGRL